MVAFDNSVHGGLRVFGGQTPPQFFVIECTHIVQLPMQVQNIGRPGTLVQIVYILRDDTHIEVLFQVYQPAVAGIWFGGKQFLAAFVVELVYQCRIAGKAIGTGHVHHGIIFPQTSGVTEGGDAAFGAHSGACGYDQFFHIMLLLCPTIGYRHNVRSYADTES